MSPPCAAPQVTEKARHYGIATALPETVDPSEGLVLQFDLKLADGLTCGGAYMKFLTADADIKFEELKDDSAYTVMFGPDKCGTTNKVRGRTDGLGDACACAGKVVVTCTRLSTSACLHSQAKRAQVSASPSSHIDVHACMNAGAPDPAAQEPKDGRDRGEAPQTAACRAAGRQDTRLHGCAAPQQHVSGRFVTSIAAPHALAPPAS